MGIFQIWDTVKGQIQTEFADIESSEATNMFAKKQEGHLSMDYTCMKWISMEKKVCYLFSRHLLLVFSSNCLILLLICPKFKSCKL